MKQKEQLTKIVGSKWILDDPETLEAYSRDNSYVSPRKPQYVVKPKDTEEVQAIVKWANKTSTPLIPVSSSPPRFRGDTVPRMGGIVVDLSRMNKIEGIDRKNKMAYLQPGVTFTQLQPELAKEGLRLPLPLLPRTSKSVIGSFLEREPIITPRYQWDVSDPLRCLEVVFGNGESMRTGEASGPGTIEDQRRIGGAQIWPEGPHQVDYHRVVQGAQGTMGIVTWASVKCETLPKLQKPYLVQAQKLDDLIDFTYRILKLGYGDELLILNNLDLAAILSDTDGIEDKRKTLPPWTLIFCIAGFERLPEERIAYQENHMKDIAQESGVEPREGIPGAEGNEVLQALSQTSEPYWKLKLNGGFQDIFFLTTLNRAPSLIDTMSEISNEVGYPPAKIGIYLQPVVQGTACHLEFTLFYNPDDAKESEQANNLYVTASKALLAKGGFFSRPYGFWSEMVYSQNTEYVAALRKVKKIFDPNNVMNPGRLCF
ncbi:MAG: FAD-binding oxidoreductase [Deltaproteobacteria bacterium]|nr:MAG: FAD-binding oxidoreductase [Deltaproteobacteria bacterium]